MIFHWLSFEIYLFFHFSKGTNKVEVIFLDLPEDLPKCNGAQIQWSGKAFMRMKNLKMLVIKNASFSRCPTLLPNSLKWLKWEGYPFTFFPYNSCSTELIHLDLSNCYFDVVQPFTKVGIHKYLTHNVFLHGLFV